MGKYIFILIFILFSCDKNTTKQQILEKGFITEKGVYYNKHYKITIKEFSNGTLTYAVSDKKNTLLYQQSILEAFSKHQFWCMYWDEHNRLWVFNSDYNSKIVWMFDDVNNQYIKKDFCKLGLKLPFEFENKVNTNLCK